MLLPTKNNNKLNFDVVHRSWAACFHEGLSKIDSFYIKSLSESQDWLPGPNNIFNAFSQPLYNVQYVLLGESPYPRKESANGFAFWDASVHELWSQNGLSKKVNRAASLRNIIKMLLLAEGKLMPDDLSQKAIAELDKSILVQTNDQLFQNFIQNKFLLLNASLILGIHHPKKHAKAWRPFLVTVLNHLMIKQADIVILMLGNIAKEIDQLIIIPSHNKLIATHPYNLSFITNPDIINFFKPLHLILKVSA